MARAIATKLARKADLFDTVFDSAGLDAANGSNATPGTIVFMKNEKVNLTNHRSKNLSPQLADGADIIFCMTKELTEDTKKKVGKTLAQKVVLFTEGVDLDTKRGDFEPPASDTMNAYRMLYAHLSAAAGRLVRTLEDPGVCPEYFGAKTLPKMYKPGSGGAGPRATESTLDPEKRHFLANLIFDLIERAFEPQTSSYLQETLKMQGHELSSLELEELLRQDLHSLIRMDKDGVWHLIPGAADKKKQKARKEARERAEEARQQKAKEKKEAEKKADIKMTEDLAFDVLGIKRETEFEDARKKYRALLKRYHPDKFHDDPDFQEMAEFKTRRINAAWDFLEKTLKLSET